MGAANYLEAGWRPLPLPAGKKSAPPDDWTGGSKKHSGEVPPRSQLAQWAVDYPQGNLAISPPKFVLGIDVDAYDGKAGAETVAAAAEEWGELPATWVSTSRPGTPSGIRWFKIPPDLAWPGKLPQGGGVELIRWDHRYAVVEPSLHPEGRDYIWVAPDLSQEAGYFPEPGELPDLPVAWVEGLTRGRTWEPRSEIELDDAEVMQWIEDRGDKPVCSVMDRTLRKWLNEIALAGARGGAHEQMLEGVWAVVNDSAAGHSGLHKALTKLKAAFKEAVKDRKDRSPADITSEWARAKAGAVQKAAALGQPEEEDLCELDATSRAPKERRRVGSDDIYERNDAGNGRRFASRYRNSVRWVPTFGSWFIWSDRLNVWVLDRDGEAERMAKEAAGTIRQEAQYEEDPKVKASILKFAVASGNQSKILAALESAKANKGMTLDGTALDSRRDLLVCPNGTVELGGEGGVRLRPSRLEDWNTISTGTRYVPGAEGSLPEWNKFLERFQPDREIREWLQRLAGYSLLGRNPKRLMIVAFGPTSTGKTTFANAMDAALGGYAAPTNMTVFRDNQDERPRPDLIKVLSRRFVYAEEASASWKLHPDQIKRITGGAPIPARVPYAKEYMDVVPAFTPWLLTNHAPSIEGADAALWRRLVVVPFDVQIPANEEDDAFQALLASDRGREAILAWLVEGYKAYLADPDSLTYVPAGAEAAGRRFRAEVSDFASALEDLCEYGERDAPEYRVGSEQLYQAYLVWCDNHRIKEGDRISLRKFGIDVKGLGYLKQPFKVDGKSVRLLTGIRLKPEWVAVATGQG